MEIKAELTEQEAQERAMLQDAREFLCSPLASEMVSCQENVDAIVAEMKAHGLGLNYGGFEAGFLLAKTHGRLRMMPASVDTAAIAAAEAERKRVAALEAEVRAAEEAKRKEIKDVQKRVEWAARDRADGRRDANRCEEDPRKANVRLIRETITQANEEIERENKKLNQKSANDPNDFSRLPSVAQIVDNGGQEMPVEQFKALSLQQAKEYRKRLFAAQGKIATEKNNVRSRK